MGKKICMHLLFLCVTFCQGIIATLSDEDARNSTESLVRKRRVINHLTPGAPPVPIENANFMVIIKENGIANCVGVILSPYTVLTVALCVSHENSIYKVYSGAAFDHISKIHTITSKVEHYGDLPHHRYEGISLITVNPPFVFSTKTANINFYNGLLPAGSRVTVFGWGCKYPPHPAAAGIRRRLRSIILPIMNHRECQNIYHNHYSRFSMQAAHNDFAISEKLLCTYDEQQYCARTDGGAPLIFNNLLVGIHVWKGEFAGGTNPDVFIDLRRDDYKQWIRENTLHAMN